MLPPPTRQGTALRTLRQTTHACATNTALRATASLTQTRSHWFWRHGVDWTSHLDPLHHRLTRYRTLKTRAKLIASLKRKAQWEYDADAPRSRSIYRCASHWSRPGHRWKRFGDEKAVEEKDDEFELSEREKRWRTRMEEFKKRVDTDPYEALFGKRFEPFWSPLVPSWMREDMGLAGWPKSRHAKEEKSSLTEDKQAATPQVKSNSADPKTPIAESRTEANAAQQRPVVHTSTTSWDSTSNRTRRVEWDSVSQETKRYEYDPISMRMVPVEAPKNEAASAIEPIKDANQKNPDEKAVNIPVKNLDESRKPIPIPAHTETSLTGPSSLSTVKDVSIAASNSSKLAALAKLPRSDLDLLTAEHVRASMGKTKLPAVTPPSNAQQKAQLERDFEAKVRSRDPEIDAILGERDLAKGRMHRRSAWDQAELMYMLECEIQSLQAKKKKLENHESGLFHIERQKKELEKLRERIEVVQKRIQRLDGEAAYQENADPKANAKVASNVKPSEESIKNGQYSVSQLQTSLDRAIGKKSEDAKDKSSPAKLQTSLERAVPRPVPRRAIDVIRETMTSRSSGNVPKNWSEQANILQAARVSRTADKKIKPLRWIEDMQARRAAFLAKNAKSVEELKQEAERKEKQTRADATLEAEVKAQKMAMQMHEDHYTHKPMGLQTSFTEENKACKAGKKLTLEEEMKQMQGEGDFCVNVTKYAGSDKWYKKPAPHALMAEAKKAEQKERDRKLVREVRDIYEKRYGTIDSSHVQPQQDTTGMVEDGVDQQVGRALAHHDGKTSYGFKKDTTEAETDTQCDKQVGKALAEHDSKIVYGFKKDNLEAELEAGVDHQVGQALAEHDSKRVYGYQKDNLETEIAAQEKAAHDAQSGTQSINQTLARTEDTLPVVSLPGPKIVNDAMPKLIPASMSSPAEISEPTITTKAAIPVTTVRWEEPPVYKLIAYDSGNDLITTVTTTSIFSNVETPISIPEALSQLYQPARFVSHFASLQSEGYQVIHATKDLLIFKKVEAEASTTTAAPEPVKPTSYEIKSPGETAVRDHARTTNPIDGMSSRPLAEPSTGNFASPTGFVNHDPVFPAEPVSRSPQESALEDQRRLDDEAVDYRHYPRVRRAERVFSGSRLSSPRRIGDQVSKSAGPRLNGGYWHDNPYRTRRSTLRERLRWALSVGAGTAVSIYVIGVAAEMARAEKKEKRRWDEVLEGKRGRYE